MTYDGALMGTLRVIADAAALDCWDDYAMEAVARDFTRTPLPDEHLSGLVLRGWLEMADVGTDLHLNVTADGRYHLDRFTKQQGKKARARA